MPYVKNDNLAALKVDVLYHLGFDTKSNDLPAMFGDVKFVCVGGTPKRMERLAYLLVTQLKVTLPTGMKLSDLTAASDRYSMYKVGPVLCVSHGMGTPSLSILLHELIKLIYYAKCSGVTFMRIGTCGGLGLDAGTVAVSNMAVDGLLQPSYDLPILGELVRRPIKVDGDLVKELLAVGAADKFAKEFKTVTGTTLCAMDFYEAQARLDGAICHYKEADKFAFLRKCHAQGVVNMEMEALTFFALCGEAGIPAAVVCVIIVNRLNGDQVVIGHDVSDELQTRPSRIAAEFIRRRLGIK